MVNRSGLSKGCANCRRRRIKCDETEPACKRCQKTGLACSGPRGTTWIVQASTTPQSTPQSPHASFTNGISFVAFEDDLCVGYARKTLVKGGCVEAAFDLLQHIGLNHEDLEPGLQLLRDAVLGLSVAFFGNQHQQMALTRRGKAIYVGVLRQLNSHLSQTDHQTTDETILTVILCMIFEICLPTGPNNFLKHVHGIETLLAARGPPTSSTGANPAMLSGVRMLCIVGAFVQDRSTIWAREEWKIIQPPCAEDSIRVPPLQMSTGQVLFSVPTEGHSIRHEMLLVLADCTTLNAEYREMSSKVVAGEDMERSKAKVTACLHKLDALYSQWDKYNASLMKEHTHGTLSFPRFANHASTTTYILYNAVLLCVLRVTDAYNPSPENIFRQNAAALNIVQSLELKAREKHQGDGEGNTIAFIAAKFAWEVLDGLNTAEGRRLACALQAGAGGAQPVGAWVWLTELSIRH